MCQARDLLSLLLATPSAPAIPGIPLPAQSAATPAQPNLLRATTVTKPPPIQSVQAFNAQLAVGGKDKALRKAAELLRSASDGVQQGLVRSEQYWIDALKIRRANWGLVPAPLPLGSATGKGADKTSKDFLVSFGLEECESFSVRYTFRHYPLPHLFYRSFFCGTKCSSSSPNLTPRRGPAQLHKSRCSFVRQIAVQPGWYEQARKLS